MRYLPNPVFFEEKGVFNILCGPKNTILPAVGMAISGQSKKTVIITGKNSSLFEKLKIFHFRINHFQWDIPEEILSLLKKNTASFVIVEYNRHLFSGNKKETEELGTLLKNLAERNQATYLVVSQFFDDNLKILGEYAGRVLIVEDNNREIKEDFVFRDNSSGYYISRQKTLSDFL
ncbi:MAG: hypothetical protein JXQ82_09690 [Methanomicrobiaceae archaeon]|nr:hypothetical protein [Methanomicrobiaceae archaeon]